MRSNIYINTCLLVSFFSLLLSTADAGAQIRRRYYPPLDLEAKNTPSDMDTVVNWINSYTSRQFVKNPLYSDGYMHNFYLSIRHLKDLQIMNGPLTLVAKPVKADSTEEPFTGLIYVDVRKSRENLKEMDLTVQNYLLLAKDHFRWSSGTILYKASWHLVNEGRAHKENQRDISRITNMSRAGAGSSMHTDMDRNQEEYTRVHFNYLIDTLNNLLGTKFPHGMKSNDLADSLEYIGYKEEHIVDRLFFTNRTDREKDSMLNLMFYMDGGMKVLREYLTHTVKISGYPFDLKIPVAAINTTYRPSGSNEGDTLTLRILSCKIELEPGQMEYQITVSLTGKFNTEADLSVPMQYFYIALYPEQGILGFYDLESKEIQTWVQWEY